MIAEVALDHAAFGDGDLAHQGGGEAEDDAALDLSRGAVGVDDVAAVGDGVDVADAELAPRRNRDVGDLADDSVSKSRALAAMERAASNAEKIVSLETSPWPASS